MGIRSFFNNQGKYFGAVPIQIQIAVTADSTHTYDVPCPENGIITGAVFVKGTGTGGSGDTIDLKTISRNGVVTSVTGAKSINTVAATIPTLMPIVLANTATQSRGFLRVVATHAAGSLIGVLTVTILPTA